MMGESRLAGSRSEQPRQQQLHSSLAIVGEGKEVGLRSQEKETCCVTQPVSIAPQGQGLTQGEEGRS